MVFSGDSSQATSIFHWRNTQPRQAGWTQSPIWSRWAVHTWRVPRPLQHPTHRLSKPHPAPTQSAPPPPRYHLAVLGAGGSAQAWQAWHRKGSDPTPPSSLPSSCRSPSKPTIWQVWPTPTPVRSSRHGLSFTEALPFLGLGAAREAGRWVFSPATVPNAAGFSTPSPPTASGRAWSLPRQGPGKSWQERVGGLLFVSIPRPSLSETQNSNHHTYKKIFTLLHFINFTDFPLLPNCAKCSCLFFLL